MNVIYFFPEGTPLDPVTIESVCIPSVGDVIHITQLEIKAPITKAYNKYEKWIVEERIFCITEPTTPYNIVNVGTQQRVEVYLKRSNIG